MAGWARCKYCHQPIWFGTNQNGKTVPFDDEDEQQLHFETCAARERVTDPTGQSHTVETCKTCGAKVWWQTTPRGKRRPMDVKGESATWDCHFDTCTGGPAGVADDYDEQWATTHGRLPGREGSFEVVAGMWLADLDLVWPANWETVNAAFRRLSMTHHPDMGGTASEFIRIKLARDRLKELLEGASV